MSHLFQPEFNDLLRRVVTRALVDAPFRALALRDSQAAFVQVAGSPAPHGLIVRFREGEGLELVLGLPDFRPGDGPLSEADLDRVVGGGDWGDRSLGCISPHGS